MNEDVPSDRARYAGHTYSPTYHGVRSSSTPHHTALGPDDRLATSHLTSAHLARKSSKQAEFAPRHSVPSLRASLDISSWPAECSQGGEGGQCFIKTHHTLLNHRSNQDRTIRSSVKICVIRAQLENQAAVRRTCCISASVGPLRDGM